MKRAAVSIRDRCPTCSAPYERLVMFVEMPTGMAVAEQVVHCERCGVEIPNLLQPAPKERPDEQT